MNEVFQKILGPCLESMEMKLYPSTMLEAIARAMLVGAKVLFQEEMMKLSELKAACLMRWSVSKTWATCS